MQAVWNGRLFPNFHRSLKNDLFVSRSQLKCNWCQREPALKISNGLMAYSYATALKQRIRQESGCQLEAGTYPKHCWNSFADHYSPNTSTKLPSVHCLKKPRLHESLDVVFIIPSWKSQKLCTRCRKIFILL